MISDISNGLRCYVDYKNIEIMTSSFENMNGKTRGK